jgi:hypothetical protein
MTRRQQPSGVPVGEPDDVPDLDDVDDLDGDFDVDRPVPISCQWGMPAWCSTGRHHRCYFTTNAEDIKGGTYGHHDGHVWTCPCPCHLNQGYPACPHPDHHEVPHPVRSSAPTPTQMNLF